MSTSKPRVVPPPEKDDLKTGPKVPAVVLPPPGFQKRHYPHWLFDPPGTLPVAFRKAVKPPPTNCYVNPAKPYIIRNLKVKPNQSSKKDHSGKGDLDLDISNLDSVGPNQSNSSDLGTNCLNEDIHVDNIDAWRLLGMSDQGHDIAAALGNLELGSESPRKRHKS